MIDIFRNIKYSKTFKLPSWTRQTFPTFRLNYSLNDKAIG